MRRSGTDKMPVQERMCTGHARKKVALPAKAKPNRLYQRHSCAVGPNQWSSTRCRISAARLGLFGREAAGCASDDIARFRFLMVPISLRRGGPGSNPPPAPSSPAILPLASGDDDTGMERLNAVLDAPAEAAAATAADAPRALTAVEQLRDGLFAEHGATLERIFAREDDEAVLIVLSLPPEGIAEEERRLAGSTELGVKVIDPATHESMLRLAEAGLIALPAGELREVYPAADSEHSEVDSRILRAKALAERAEHKLKAAALLESGGGCRRSPPARGGGGPARRRLVGRDARRGRARRHRFGCGLSARGRAGLVPRRPAARSDTRPVGRRGGRRRGGADRRARVPHLPDARRHARRLAPSGPHFSRSSVPAADPMNWIFLGGEMDGRMRH